jgi:hypothetical protein
MLIFLAFSIGGDETLKTVVTLASQYFNIVDRSWIFNFLDILRQFNSQLDGYSQGNGDRNNSKAGFNVAKAGAISS